MSTGTQYDVIVIGGGASGMMAAGRAAARGRRVLLIEKNKDLGKKLSITGGGRCNILNAEPDTRTLLSHYGDAAKYLHSPFSQHGMKDSWEFFESLGVPIVVEARKRAFPASQDARDVTRALRRYVTSNNVELKVGTKVQRLVVENNTVTEVVTNNGSYKGKEIILATGGASHPETGSTGDWMGWIANLGHTVHESNPNIVPLTVADDWVKALSGTSLSFMKITFGTNRGKNPPSGIGRFSKTGKILFTHFGVSGPLILNAAHEVKRLLKNGPVPSAIDMYPDTEIGTLRNRVLELFNEHKNKTVKNILKDCTPAGMTAAVAAQLRPEVLESKVHSVSKEDREFIADIQKAMPLTITGTMGLDWAVISDGGIDLSEVDMRTMRSKKIGNLLFTGDVLHINRPSGGYSLQLCWTTGWVAGNTV